MKTRLENLSNFEIGAIGFILLGLLSLILFYIPDNLNRVQTWAEDKVIVPLKKEKWRIYYGESQTFCEDEKSISSGCPASPKNKFLWDSAFRRIEKEHKERVFSRLGQEYWIGIKISGNKIKRAYEQKANHLFLGRMRGDFKLWIDGEAYISALRSGLQPLIVPLSKARLKEGKEMYVAIRLMNNSLTGSIPDVGDSRFGLGFITHGQATQYFYHSVYWREFLFVILTAFFFVLSLITLKDAVSLKENHLYFFALFFLSSACVSVYYIQTVWTSLGFLSKMTWKTIWFSLFAFSPLLTALSLKESFEKIVSYLTLFLLAGLIVLMFYLNQDYDLAFDYPRWARGSIFHVCTTIAGILCILFRKYLLGSTFISLVILNFWTFDKPYSSVDQIPLPWFIQVSVCLVTVYFQHKREIISEIDPPSEDLDFDGQEYHN